MTLRENLSSIISSVGKNNFSPPRNTKVGRVYGVVTTQDTPTPEMFIKAGGYGGLGTIFYLDYEQAKKVTGSIDNDFLKTCKTAKPKTPQDQYYPVRGELVFIEKGPSPFSQVSNTSGQKYYSLINLWNTRLQNSQPANSTSTLGLTFTENPNVRPLIPYEGDNILGGRQGSSLRFTSTTKGVIPLNEWSSLGNEIDPITILTNGLAYDPNKQYYVEQINKDASSIYLTSAQKIPLQTDKTGILNSLTNPISVSDYFSSQAILNADRIVLNSKKDEVMLFAKTNIELNTKNVINLNADTRIHLNSNSIFLGPYDKTKTYPTQPVLLGYETAFLFDQIQQMLTKLGVYLSTAISTSEGSPLLSVNAAGKELLKDTQKMCDLIEKITSKNVFTT